MTKERRLAIKMWKEIKVEIPNWHEADIGDIATELKAFKKGFCYSYHLEWLFSCWFCTYTGGLCEQCPLHSCEYDNSSTAWARIVSNQSSLEVRLAACDEIIKALGGNPND